MFFGTASLTTIAICLHICKLYAYYLPDELVDGFPGQEKPANFRQFSGFLDISPSRHIHYVYFESQKNPATDPIVFWTNGGTTLKMRSI
jgi:hypothetical protein